VALSCILIVFLILHLAHVSSFYTIKMYMESVDVAKLRENFIVKPNDSNEGKFKSLIVAEVSSNLPYLYSVTH
jgi:hypothetical protein